MNHPSISRNDQDGLPKSGFQYPGANSTGSSNKPRILQASLARYKLCSPVSNQACMPRYPQTVRFCMISTIAILVTKSVSKSYSSELSFLQLVIAIRSDTVKLFVIVRRTRGLSNVWRTLFECLLPVDTALSQLRVTWP